MAHLRVARADAVARAAQARSLAEFRQRHMAETLRDADRFVKQLERQGKIRAPGSAILKRPRERIVRPRKIRSDFGKRHLFKGRPGFPLRLEDIAHADD